MISDDIDNMINYIINNKTNNNNYKQLTIDPDPDPETEETVENVIKHDYNIFFILLFILSLIFYIYF